MSNQSEGFNADPNSKDLYKRLGVSKDADQKEIKSKFRKCTFKFHPDRNPDLKNAEELMRNINEAYDVLSDPKKRRIYDLGGTDAVRDHENNGMNMNQGGGFPFPFPYARYQERERKGRTIERKLPCRMEDLFNGKVRRIRVNRNRICKKCDGHGGKTASVRTECDDCNGQGRITVTKQIKPGYISQSVTHCPHCEGTGKAIPKGMECSECQGKSVVSEAKVLEVNVDRGMFHGQRIRFPGESHEEPGVKAGDIEFVIHEMEHKYFKHRRPGGGIDLEMQKKISLAEALTSTKFFIDTLDGRKLKVETKEGEIIKPGSEKMIRGEGMPRHGRPYERGNLIIRFEVEFPDHVPKKLSALLKKMIPKNIEKRKKNMKKGDGDEFVEEVKLEEKEETEEDESKNKNNRFESWMTDDEVQGEREYVKGENIQGCSVM